MYPVECKWKAENHESSKPTPLNNFGSTTFSVKYGHL